MKNLNGKKKVAILAGLILLIIGLVATIYLVQRTQDSRSNAAKSTTLTLTNTTSTIAPGGDAKLDLNISPGTNLVNYVKFTIKFDPAVFNPALTVLNIDQNSLLKKVSGPTYTDNGTVTYVLDTGTDQTVAVSTAQKIGTIVLPARDNAKSGTYDVKFDEPSIEIKAVGSTENVFSSSTPTSVVIAAQCIPTQGTCSWDAVEGATKYQYVIKDQDGKETPGETSELSATFEIKPGGTYTCTVKAVNDCGGVGEAGEEVSTCSTTTGTPTPTISGSRSTPTPTPRSTATPTPTVVRSTPTPTTPGITSSSSPTPTSQIYNSPTPIATTDITTTPTLPPTGNPFVIGGIIGGVLILLGGLALLIL